MEHVNTSIAAVSYIMRARESGSGGFMKGAMGRSPPLGSWLLPM